MYFLHYFRGLLLEFGSKKSEGAFIRGAFIRRSMALPMWPNMMLKSLNTYLILKKTKTKTCQSCTHQGMKMGLIMHEFEHLPAS